MTTRTYYDERAELHQKMVDSIMKIDSEEYESPIIMSCKVIAPSVSTFGLIGFIYSHFANDTPANLFIAFPILIIFLCFLVKVSIPMVINSVIEASSPIDHRIFEEMQQSGENLSELPGAPYREFSGNNRHKAQSHISDFNRFMEHRVYGDFAGKTMFAKILGHHLTIAFPTVMGILALIPILCGGIVTTYDISMFVGSLALFALCMKTCRSNASKYRKEKQDNANNAAFHSIEFALLSKAAQ